MSKSTTKYIIELVINKMIKIKEGIVESNYNINKCIPYTLKYARVVPIYKREDMDNIANFRPISIIIPAFTKPIQTVVCTRLVAYLTKINLLATQRLLGELKSYGIRGNALQLPN